MLNAFTSWAFLPSCFCSHFFPLLVSLFLFCTFRNCGVNVDAFPSNAKFGRIEAEIARFLDGFGVIKHD